ncbi:hypothetical protein ENTCAN_06583 [Enterobacter cancerogenus ATCC 35316]|nr:hypothetical protein ENTCAN_06583 [Enterobacter cancerogenus ATCC 35316]
MPGGGYALPGLLASSGTIFSKIFHVAARRQRSESPGAYIGK